MGYERYAAPPRRDLDYVVGVDLGQTTDYTAIAIVERVKVAMGDMNDPEIVNHPERFTYEAHYHLRYLERPELGTKYPVIVSRVIGLLDRAPLSRETPFVVDRTGVGRPVTDMFEAAGLEPFTVTIHGGDEVIHEGRHYRVPKRDLVGVLIALYQTDRLKVAKDLALAPVLNNELVNFKVKIDLRTAHDSYEAWRESVHDDLVLAVALACWCAERNISGFGGITEEAAEAWMGFTGQ